MAIDDTIPDLPAKDVMFRIYRDLRFSTDKKPYKVTVTPIFGCLGEAEGCRHTFPQHGPERDEKGHMRTITYIANRGRR
jgi:uncharacterized protein (DUF2461 family)